MNDALLGKWWWNIITRPDQMISRMITVKYGARNGVWFGVDRNVSNTSIFYKGLLSARMVFRMGMEIHIGNGEKTNFWNDKWCLGVTLAKEFPAIFNKARNENGSAAKVWCNHAWKPSFRGRLNEEENMEKNKMLTLIQNKGCDGNQDRPVWRWEKGGTYSVKSSYHFIKHGGVVCSFANVIWNIKCPKKVILFIWLSLNNAILTWDNLQKRGWKGPGRCIMCMNEGENVDHLLYECTWAARVWNVFRTRFKISTNLVKNLWVQKDSLGTSPGRRSLGYIFAATIVWSLWIERNNRTFRNSFMSFDCFLNQCLRLGQLWAGTLLQEGRRPPADAADRQDDGEGSRRVRRRL